MTREASSATFHGWKDVDLIVRSNEIEVDEDDLNEGFCHYSIINDDEQLTSIAIENTYMF